MSFRIEHATPLAVLRELPAALVQTCVTSPPQWERDGTGSHYLARAPTPELYVQRTVQVMREVNRVLRVDGTAWVKLSEPHSANGDLIGLPWQVALALQADGWSLRRDIVAVQRNPVGERVRDRPTAAHEYLFLLSKQPGYYYDADAISEPAARRQWPSQLPHTVRLEQSRNGGCAASNDRRSWWPLYSGTQLVERCVLAGSAARACGACGAPWSRDVRGQLRATCAHNNPAGKSLVLDPFCGTATTGITALRLGRSFLGIEPSSGTARLARRRLSTARERVQ
jgi:DNA modification methylase